MTHLEIAAVIRAAYPGASGYGLEAARSIERLMEGLREAIHELEHSGLSFDHPTLKSLRCYLDQ